MARLIDADDLLKKLGVSERFNADIPAWVIGVIKGMDSPSCATCRWYNAQHHVCDCFEDLYECPHCGRTTVKSLELEFPVNGFCSYYERKKK